VGNLKRKDRWWILLVLILVVVGIFLFRSNEWTLFRGIEEAIADKDATVQEVYHAQVHEEKLLAFYRTQNNELAAGILKRRYWGYSFSDYAGRAPMFSDPDMTWQGFQNSTENVSLLFGAINNPGISQVIILSESNVSASIIRSGASTFWYYVTTEPLHAPITLRATDKEGIALYEFGDFEHWGDNKRVQSKEEH